MATLLAAKRLWSGSYFAGSADGATIVSAVTAGMPALTAGLARRMGHHPGPAVHRLNAGAAAAR